MTATTIALLLALLLLPLLVLLWATESTEQRTKRLASYGWSQRRIAFMLRFFVSSLLQRTRHFN